MLTNVHVRVRRLTSSSFFSGRIPFVNLLAFTLQLLGIFYVSWNFDLHFAAKPMLTTMVMNTLLNGIADAIAQTVSVVRQGSLRHRSGSSKKDSVSIEIHELGEKSLPLHRNEQFAASPFDVERLVRYMSWGFFMAPVQLMWFAFLAAKFPIGEDNKTSSALWRVLCDQVFFSPFGLALFFIFMTLAEGGGSKAVRRKFDGVFFSALKSNYVLWPAVQILNFRVVPLQFQLPFASTIGICWTTYLSLKNEEADA